MSLSLTQLFSWFTGQDEDTYIEPDPMEIDESEVPDFAPSRAKARSPRKKTVLEVQSDVSDEEALEYIQMLRKATYPHDSSKKVEVEKLFGGRPYKTSTLRGKQISKKDETANWFNDEIMNLFFASLEKQYAGVVCLSTWNAADPSFIEKLSSDKISQAQKRNHLRTGHTLLCPIHINGNHFGLLLITCQNGVYKATCVDTKNWHHLHGPFLKFAQKLIEVLHGPQELAIFQSCRVPKQIGDDDCGPGACFLGFSQCANKNIEEFANIAEYDMDYYPYRKNVTKTIYDSIYLQENTMLVSNYRKNRQSISVTPPSSPRLTSPRRNVPRA